MKAAKKNKRKDHAVSVFVAVIFLILLFMLFSFGKRPAKPLKGYDVIEFSLGPYNASPNQEFIICEYRKLKEDVKIVSFTPNISKGTHHVLLYPGFEDEGIVNNCDWHGNNILYGASTNNDTFMFRKGLSLNIKAGTTLGYQFHYKDRSNSSIQAYGRLQIGLIKDPTEEVKVRAYNINIIHDIGFLEVPVGYSSKTAEIPIEEDIEIFSLGIHMHESDVLRSIYTVYKITQKNEEFILVESDWEGNRVRFYTPGEPIKMRKGDKFTIKCESENIGNKTIYWPDVMCAFGYLYRNT